MYRNAIFDSPRRYRYSLTRVWENGKGKAVFILLNPSIANESEDDPTVTRCINFANGWGYGKIEIVNLFGRITPYPKLLKEEFEKNIDLIGRDNNSHILKAAETAKLVILGWGADYGSIINRDKEVLNILKGKELFCLGKNVNGSPRHPSRLEKNLKPTLF